MADIGEQNFPHCKLTVELFRWSIFPDLIAGIGLPKFGGRTCQVHALSLANGLVDEKRS
jgi:hypothetical protein